MTSRKHLKRKVRERCAKTGESYATALRHLRRNVMEGTQVSTLEGDEAQIIASCSFCKKNKTEVMKLIAGGPQPAGRRAAPAAASDGRHRGSGRG